MTNDEIMMMTAEEIEARMSEIKTLIEKNEEGTDFEALSLELDSINERKSALAEEARKADIKAVIEDDTTSTTIEIPKEETRKMADIKEIRASKEYVEAYAEYIKTNDDTECRALLTELAPAPATGSVPVPVIVEDYINTAWSKHEILSRCKKTFIKGVLRVGFELSASDAVAHNEGADAPDEEELVIGVVELSPVSLKKWLSVSDEALDLKGEAFLRYIYDEITDKIAKLAEDTLINKIIATSSTATATSVSVASVSADPAMGIVAQALSALADNAVNPVVVINKGSLGALKAIQYANSYAVDIFEGLTVLFNDQITSLTTATTGDTYMIVGDFGVGAQFNFPNGEEVKIKFDDLSLAEADLVKIIGREYAGIGVVSCNAFAQVKVAS